MSIHLFWDKYDRYTTCKSFFEINYREFTPELSSRDYEHIISTKLCEDLQDDFLNALKIILVRNFELLEASYTSELCLCSQKRLIKFMENVLEYLKLERIYLSYLEYPLKTGLPSGENTLPNSLLRFRCLMNDFKLIFGFNSKKEMEDFENAKDLVEKFSIYFKTGLTELKDYCLELKKVGKNYYSNEFRIICEILTLCDEIQSLQKEKVAAERSPASSLTDFSKTNEIDELSFILGNNNVDYRTQFKTSLQASSGKAEGLSYKRLEPEYQLRVNNLDQSVLSKNSSGKKPGNFATAPVGSDSHDYLHPKKYDFHKYDKEFKDPRVFNAKGKVVKEVVKEEINVATILSKGRMNQDMTLFNTYQDATKKPAASSMDHHHGKNSQNFPLTHYLERFKDDEFGELLSLVNIDFDVNTGMKLSTNAAQQAKIKQRAADLEEHAQLNSTDRRPRITQEEKTEKESDCYSEFSNESDSDCDDMNIREKRLLLERRRRNLIEEADIDTEFGKIATGLHGEPTIINNYAFYENTLLKYEKPTREYLTETETVIERQTHAVGEVNNDYCYRELSPRAGRRKFLERVYGEKVERKLYEKFIGVTTKTNVAEISNNKALRGDVLRNIQKEIEISKGKALQKSAFARESVECFFKFYEDSFKQCETGDAQRRQRIKYLWDVVRNFLNTRIFYKKQFRRSVKKDLDALAKIKTSTLLQNLLRGQESLIFSRKDKENDREFVVLNRLLKYQLKLDYIINFELIMKPSNQ